MFLASSFTALGTCLSENEKLQAGEALGSLMLKVT